jgi:hypothetical protein
MPFEWPAAGAVLQSALADFWGVIEGARFYG